MLVCSSLERDEKGLCVSQDSAHTKSCMDYKRIVTSDPSIKISLINMIFLGIFFVLVGLFCLEITTNLDKDIDDRNLNAVICVISFFIAFCCFCY